MLVKGKWNLTWGAVTVEQVESIEVSYERDSSDYSTVQHKTYELRGAAKASVAVTLLGTDIAALAALVPQYAVANGGTMSTGETVNDADGAIDVLATCDDQVFGDFEITSCEDPGQVYRLVNAYSDIDGVEFDDKIRKVTIKFVGEPGDDQGSIQFFKEGTLTPAS